MTDKQNAQKAGPPLSAKQQLVFFCDELKYQPQEGSVYANSFVSILGKGFKKKRTIAKNFSVIQILASENQWEKYYAI